VHGFPLSRKLWQAQMEGLAEAAHVIAVDLRGHGESGGAGEAFTMEQFADDLVAFLDACQISEKIVLGGLSMGGYVSMAFLRKHPQRLAGLLLTATRAAADSPEGRANRDKSIALVQAEGTAPLLEGMLGKLLSPHSLEHRPDLAAQARAVMQGITAQTVMADLRGLKARPDSTTVLQAAHLPVCIIHGADDQIVPAAEAQALHTELKNSRLHILPHAGHLPNLEQPELFNQAVQAFLREVTA
jgi:pimeloyl-ACP methyl ester carboxylesterase